MASCVGLWSKGSGWPAISPAHRRDGCTRHVHTWGLLSSRSHGGARFLSPGGGRARPRPIHWHRQKSEVPPRRRWHWTMGAPAPRHAGPSPVARRFHRGRSDRTLPTSSRRGTWKQTAHQPAVMLTARLWTPTGVACTDTTFFYNSLERKGNDRGHFVSEPISTVSLTESTGSWEGSTFSPRLMLICELKAKGNFYRPVAQEVCPWFAYSNDDGYLVKEAPPPPPMAPTASPPGPARDLDPFRGIWADPPADSGDRGAPGRRRRHAATSPRHGRASGHELCGVDGWNHSNSSFLLRNIQAL